MSFLSNFRLFTSCSEVHPNHAIWAGLVTLSSLAGKRVSIDMGHFEVFTNLYVVFVAPPGHRKSTAMDFAGRFLEECKGIPVGVDCVTKEAIVGAMMSGTTSFVEEGKPPFVYTPLTILATELSEFIGASKDGMINFLTTLFDKRGDYSYQTIKRGVEHITLPYLVLLGCTTPAWITARLRDDVISGGFSRRAIFVYETERARRIAFPTVTDEMRTAWDDALAYAEKIRKVRGKFTWEPAARDFFEQWYTNLVVPRDPMLTGYYESKHVQLLKIAQLISLSDSTDLVLRLDHLQFGLGLLDMVEQNLSRVFEGVGRNELNGLAATMCDLVRSAGGGIPEKKVIGMMFSHGTEGEIRQVVDHLINTERLVRAGMVNTKTQVIVQCLFTKDGYEKFKREQEFKQSTTP